MKFPIEIHAAGAELGKNDTDHWKGTITAAIKKLNFDLAIKGVSASEPTKSRNMKQIREIIQLTISDGEKVIELHDKVFVLLTWLIMDAIEILAGESNGEASQFISILPAGGSLHDLVDDCDYAPESGVTITRVYDIGKKLAKVLTEELDCGLLIKEADSTE